jgi:hypothetical protein
MVTDPHALSAPLATIHCHIGRPILEPFILPHLIAVKDGISFRAILGAKFTTLCGANFNTDMGYEIHDRAPYGCIGLNA